MSGQPRQDGRDCGQHLRRRPVTAPARIVSGIAVGGMVGGLDPWLDRLQAARDARDGESNRGFTIVFYFL